MSTLTSSLKGVKALRVWKVRLRLWTRLIGMTLLVGMLSCYLYESGKARKNEFTQYAGLFYFRGTLASYALGWLGLAIGLAGKEVAGMYIIALAVICYLYLGLDLALIILKGEIELSRR